MAWPEQLPSGRWRAAFRDNDGRTHKTDAFGSKRAAMQAGNDEEAKVRNGTFFDPNAGKVTFSDYFEHQWLPNRGGEIATVASYRSHYNVCLKAKFGKMELRTILPSTVQGWVTEMTREGTTPATTKARVTMLQTVLAAQKGTSARRDGLIQVNPCEGVTLPKVVAPPVRIYEHSEVNKILDAMDPWWRVLALLGAESAARWGELMGLHVGAFSLEYRTMTIRRTIVETDTASTGNGTRFAWKDYPKSGNQRTIGLRPLASEAIKLMVAERGLTAEDRLFSMPVDGEGKPLSGRRGVVWRSEEWTPERTSPWECGMPISRAFFRQSVWIPAIEKAGVPYLKFHALRASHLSWMIAVQPDMSVVMDRAGHSDFDTTKRYRATVAGAEDAALAALDKFLGR